MNSTADKPQLWTDEERWQVLNDNVKDFGVFMLDSDGRIATWNSGAERVLGFMTNEILGQPYACIFTSEDVSKDQPEFELREAREKGRSEDERWHLRRDGTRFWASGVVTPLWASNGTLRGYAKIVRDITQRKMAELAAIDANRTKDEFLAVLSHEFRNPLAAILSSTELLKMEPNPSEIVRQACAAIERQSQGLVRMVDDLLDVSRINSGKLQLNRVRTELKQIIQHALETSQPITQSRKHHLEVSIPSEAIWVDGDAQRLAQVFANILINAAKYTDPGGSVTLNVVREGNCAVIRVTDTGSGILSEMLPRIFEPFVQVDRSRDRSHGGLGIGLSLVKRIVEMHGGKVDVFSEGIGKGSEFVVHLPVVAEYTALSPDDARVESATGKARKLKIIVAEDNTDSAASLAMLLRTIGHDATIVDSGPAALLMADQIQPDVMLIDIGLPGMDGYKVASFIRNQECHASIRLVAVTGYAHAEDRERALHSGFDDHLAKPVDFKTLMSILDHLLREGARSDTR